MTNEANNQNQWQQQLDNMRSLKQQMDNLPDDAENGDAVVESYCKARDALLTAKAPNVAAMAQKLTLLMDMSSDGSVTPADIALLQSDAERLAA
ncbi:MAG: hypothetical protein ABJO01_10125 [Parasphingorhabdus sp.]|uniref:hypothetical protein n=1 Tax=Parasphingorhabdus sp. TaxID=2709688 RepID=UPI003297BC9B